MREYGLAGNMHFRFLHLINQVLKSTRHTTGGRCSVSAQASGAGSAVIGLQGSSAASHGRRRRAIPTQDFSMGADAPWCGSTSRSTQGRDTAPSGSHSRGSAVGSAVVPDSPLPCNTGVPLVIDSSRRSAASVLDARLSSFDSSSSSVTRHRRAAASYHE